MLKISKVKVFELVAAVMTGIGKFIFMEWLNWKLAYIISLVYSGWAMSYTGTDKILKYSNIGGCQVLILSNPLRSFFLSDFYLFWHLS